MVLVGTVLVLAVSLALITATLFMLKYLQLDTAITNMRIGMAQNYMQPKVVIGKVLPQIKAMPLAIFETKLDR